MIRGADRSRVAAMVFAITVAMATAAAADEWETLVRRTDARVDLNVSSIERGKNGGVTAYVLTMHAEPQKTPDGSPYRNATSVIEYDCGGQRSWLHGVGYEMQSKLVGVNRYPDAKAVTFQGAETLTGVTERAMCAYLLRKGLR